MGMVPKKDFNLENYPRGLFQGTLYGSPQTQTPKPHSPNPKLKFPVEPFYLRVVTWSLSMGP